jgi:hypothetical protein
LRCSRDATAALLALSKRFMFDSGGVWIATTDAAAKAMEDFCEMMKHRPARMRGRDYPWPTPFSAVSVELQRGGGADDLLYGGRGSAGTVTGSTRGRGAGGGRGRHGASSSLGLPRPLPPIVVASNALFTQQQLPLPLPPPPLALQQAQPFLMFQQQQQQPHPHHQLQQQQLVLPSAPFLYPVPQQTMQGQPLPSSPQLEAAYHLFPPPRALVGGAPLPLASPQQFFTAPAAAQPPRANVTTTVSPVTQLPMVRLPLAPPPPVSSNSCNGSGSGSSGHNGQPQPLLTSLSQSNPAPLGMVNMLQQALTSFLAVTAAGHQQHQQQQAGHHHQQGAPSPF